MMQEHPPTLHDTVVDVLRPLIADNGVSSGRIVDFVIGNGSTITEYAADLLVQAQNEVLLSTCFWAQSDSLATLYDALITLNNRARVGMRRVTVKILFSSFSLSQKFFSYKGLRKWGPKIWEKLGLPSASLLDSLDMMVVSRFQRPIGVMHGKFVVIDRKALIVMSSNISWEDWYEIAVRMEGSIILPFLDYFFRYYRPSRGTVLPCPVAVRNVQISEAFAELHGQSLYGFHSREVPITFLACGPSRLGTLPFAPIRALPARFQIEAISHARRSIFMQSPNLTSRGIIHAIKGALLKSVSVEIYLPRNMMIFESIVTGLSTTSCRVKFLQKWAKRRMPVNLKVEWFKSDDSQEFRVEDDKSHVKFMVVDEELVVVGSSNLDRASACTSGEVNVAISDPEIARMVLGAVKRHQSTGKVDV